MHIVLHVNFSELTDEAGFITYYVEIFCVINFIADFANEKKNKKRQVTTRRLTEVNKGYFK